MGLYEITQVKLLLKLSLPERHKEYERGIRDKKNDTMGLVCLLRSGGLWEYEYRLCAWMSER